MKAFWKKLVAAAKAFLNSEAMSPRDRHAIGWALVAACGLALTGCINLPDIPDIDWPDVPAVVTNLPPIIDPKPDEGATVPIKPGAGVVYVMGTHKDKGKRDVLNPNIGHGVNLRLYVNSGRLPVPCKKGIKNGVRAWYYLDAGIVPAGSYAYRFNGDGSLFVRGQDFVSLRTGQHYRWEGFSIGKSESDPYWPYSQATVPKSSVRGALILHWAAVEAK